MPFFEFSINDSESHILGGTSLDFIEFGLLSVGPDFDVDLLSNGRYDGKVDSVSFLNKKVYCGDVIQVLYRDDSPTAENPMEQDSDKTVDKNELSGNTRKFKIEEGDERNIMLSATNGTTLSANFIWNLKEGKCKLILGITDYQGNEQWSQVFVEPDQKYTITVE